MPLNQVVEEIKLVFASKITQKRIIVRNQVSKDVVAYGDPQMIEIMLRNLIANAMKYTYPGGSITVAGECNNQGLVITITDRGTGIEHGDLPKLFRLDTKFSQEGTAGEKGTGLGLILCQALAANNNGTIRLESEIGRGTTVTVQLPAA